MSQNDATPLLLGLVVFFGLLILWRCLIVNSHYYRHSSAYDSSDDEQCIYKPQDPWETMEFFEDNKPKRLRRAPVTKRATTTAPAPVAEAPVVKLPAPAPVAEAPVVKLPAPAPVTKTPAPDAKTPAPDAKTPASRPVAKALAKALIRATNNPGEGLIMPASDTSKPTTKISITRGQPLDLKRTTARTVTL